MKPTVVFLLLAFTCTGNTFAAEKEMRAVTNGEACAKGAKHGAVAAAVGIALDCLFLGCAITAATMATIGAPGLVIAAGAETVASATVGCVADVVTN